MNNTNFFRKFTKIKGDYPISNIRRLPWKDKIRLGIQVPTIERDENKRYKLDSKGNPIQRRDKFGELEFHPQDIPYFICPAEVQKKFGKEPTELDIAFPLSGLDENGLPDVGGIFPQAYKYYGSSRGLKCVGDGEIAMRANEKGIFEEVECPCDKFGQKDGCSKRASLLFFIPSISLGGIYVIDSGSWNTMVDIQSGIYLALELLKDPITGQYNSIIMLPFKLRRGEKETQHENRKDKHWPLTCELNLTIPEIKKIREGQTLFYGQKRVYQIENRAEEINPKFDSEKEGAVVVRPEEIKEEVKEKKEKEAGVQEKQKEAKEPIKEKAKEQDLKKEIEESRAREANLKKEHEEGKDKIKSYQESKILSKKRVEEENKILNEICLKAQKAGIDSFEKLINFALDRGIFQTPLAEHLAKKILISNKDIYDRLMRALEPLKEEDKEKLDKMFSVLSTAGISTWRTVAWFACKADLVEPGASVEDVQKILLNDPEAIEKIIEIAKIED